MSIDIIPLHVREFLSCLMLNLFEYFNELELQDRNARAYVGQNISQYDYYQLHKSVIRVRVESIIKLDKRQDAFNQKCQRPQQKYGTNVFLLVLVFFRLEQSPRAFDVENKYHYKEPDDNSDPASHPQNLDSVILIYPLFLILR